MELTMAIVKASYTRSGEGAKATIRYISHRPNDHGTRVTRQLFGTDGAMSRDEAYRLIDAAEKGSVFFRFVLSPDPDTEDPLRDLHLRLVTEEALASLAAQLDTAMGWVAAVHDDHSPHRHVHVVAAVQGRVEREHLQRLREQATRVCQLHRAELDRGDEQRHVREEAVWEFQR